MPEAYRAVNLLSGKLSVPEQERDFKAPAAIGVALSQLSLLRFIFHEGFSPPRETVFQPFLISIFS